MKNKHHMETVEEDIDVERQNNRFSHPMKNASTNGTDAFHRNSIMFDADEEHDEVDTNRKQQQAQEPPHDRRQASPETPSSNHSSMPFFSYRYDATDDDFIKTILDSAVDGPCQSVTLPTCQVNMESQLEALTHCRHPMSFLSIFGGYRNDGEDGHNLAASPEAVPGAYVVPEYCEYCGSHDTRHCGAGCTRPRLYFQKKRPPFSKRDNALWDATSDHAVSATTASAPRITVSDGNKRKGSHNNSKKQSTLPAVKPSTMPPMQSTPQRWVSGLFGDN